MFVPFALLELDIFWPTRRKIEETSGVVLEFSEEFEVEPAESSYKKNEVKFDIQRKFGKFIL